MENDERIRRLILQLSGVFYEMKEKFLIPFAIKLEEELSKQLEAGKDLNPLSYERLRIKIKDFSNEVLEELVSILLKESIKIISRNLDALTSSNEESLNLIKSRLQALNDSLMEGLADRNTLIKKILIKELKYRILDLVEASKEVDLKIIRSKFKSSKSAILKNINLLKKEGYISVSKEGGNLKIVFQSAPWHYKL